MSEKFIGTDTYQQLLENTYSLFTNLAMLHNTTIWHSGGGVYNSSADVGIFNTSQISIGEVSPVERSSTQISVGQISASQIGMIQTHIIETGSTQVGSPQNGGEQFGTTKISTNQVSVTEVTLGQIGSTQVGITQVGTFQGSGNHHTLTQISPTEVSIGEIGGSKIGFTQVDTTEINTNQIAAAQINVPKVSLSSSIPFQQFFNLHNLNFVLNNTYKHNPQNFWSTLFDPTNPFDLTLQIEDLPTGQLAEAQITKYDSLGRPNGGTLLIDTDANGTIILNPDGTITYTPNSTFVGTDTFTYIVKDRDGLTSNEATVNHTYIDNAYAVYSFMLVNRYSLQWFSSILWQINSEVV